MANERATRVWASLTRSQKAAFKLVAGIGADKGKFEKSVVNGLFERFLIKRTTNLINGEEIVVLTSEGKRVKRAALADAAQEE